MSYDLNTIPYAVFVRLLDLATRTELAILQDKAPQWQHSALIKEYSTIGEIKIFPDSNKFLNLEKPSCGECDVKPGILNRIFRIILIGFHTMESSPKILRAFDYRVKTLVKFEKCVVNREFIYHVNKLTGFKVARFFFDDCTLFADVTPGFLCSMYGTCNELELTVTPRKNWIREMPEDIYCLSLLNCTLDVFDIVRDEFVLYMKNKVYHVMLWALEEVDSAEELDEHVRQLFKDDFEYILIDDGHYGSFQHGYFRTRYRILGGVNDISSPVCVHIVCDSFDWSYLLRPKSTVDKDEWRPVTSTNTFIYYDNYSD